MVSPAFEVGSIVHYVDNERQIGELGPIPDSYKRTGQVVQVQSSGDVRRGSFFLYQVDWGTDGGNYRNYWWCIKEALRHESYPW